MHWTLIRKDIIQHLRPLMVLLASAFALPPAFSLLSRSDGDGAGYAGIVFGFLAIGVPMLFGQWFVGQEKIKGTFRLLRSLPISGTDIILAKYLGSTLLCLFLVNGPLLFEPAVCRALGLNVPQPAAVLVIGTNLTAAFLIAVSVTLFTLLDVRMASQIIVWSVCIFIVALSLAGKYLEGLEIGELNGGGLPSIFDPRIVAIAGIFFAGFPTAMVWLGARIFEKREWSQLEEG